MAPRLQPINRHYAQSDHISGLLTLKNQSPASSALGQNIRLELMITQFGGRRIQRIGDFPRNGEWLPAPRLDGRIFHLLLS
jgi:hypothetical protein